MSFKNNFWKCTDDSIEIKKVFSGKQKKKYSVENRKKSIQWKTENLKALVIKE